MEMITDEDIQEIAEELDIDYEHYKEDENFKAMVEWYKKYYDRLLEAKIKIH
jgi:ribulose 1,5-bisphosphate synthetase/thiazole synthase